MKNNLRKFKIEKIKYNRNSINNNSFIFLFSQVIFNRKSKEKEILFFPIEDSCNLIKHKVSQSA